MEGTMEYEELVKEMATLISEAAGALADTLDPGDRKVSQRIRELAVILEDLGYDLRLLVKRLP